MTNDLHSQVEDALNDLGMLCDAVSEVLMAHLHDGGQMTCALDTLGEQLPKRWQATSDRVLELCKEGGDDA